MYIMVQGNFGLSLTVLCILYVLLYISQNLEEELTLATEAFLESDSVTVDLIRREVGETPQ